MRPTEPLPLYHSWPILDRDRQFALGALLNAPERLPAEPSALARCGAALAPRGIGVWECDLADETLTWSEGVYDLFGLPRHSRVAREDAVALYCSDSAAAMEKLRKHALAHRRGFTLDAEIRPGHHGRRWMRLIAAPVCEDGRPVKLHGLKVGL